MRQVASIAFVIALYGSSHADAAVHRDDSPDVIPLYMSEERVLMMLRVAGRGPIPVVFDTGTSDNLLDKATAEVLVLPHIGPSTSIDGATGKPLPGYQTRLIGATISGVPLKGELANVIDQSGRDDAGVFGPNSFTGRFVRIDLGHRKLILTDKSPTTLPLGYSTPYLKIGDQDGLPATRVAIGSFSFDAVVDLGNTGGLILPRAWAEKLPLDHPPIPNGRFVTAGSTQVSYTARLRGKMRVGCLTLTNPQLSFMDGSDTADVGIQILRRLSIVLDPEEKRSWLEGCSAKSEVPSKS